MTVYVNKNSDTNAIISPYTSLPGSLKPHGLNKASVKWHTLGKFSSYQRKKQSQGVSVIFCELLFSAKDWILEFLTSA